jgi:hypothetical protein
MKEEGAVAVAVAAAAGVGAGACTEHVAAMRVVIGADPDCIAYPPTVEAALRLAVIRTASGGHLSPIDLAAAARAFPRHSCAWAEEAAEAAVRGTLPRLVDELAADPTAPPHGATSWRAVHRRVHVAATDQRLAIAADIGCFVDHKGGGTLWTWGTDHFGCLGDGGLSDEEGRQGDGGNGGGRGSNGNGNGNNAGSTDDDMPTLVNNDEDSSSSDGGDTPAAPRRRCTPRRVTMKITPETATGTTGRATGRATGIRTDAGTGTSEAQQQQPSSSAAAAAAAVRHDDATSSRQTLPTMKLASPRMRVMAIAVGGAHVVAADDSGGCWTWGKGINGQLGRVVVTRRRRLNPADAVEGDRSAQAEAAFDPRPTRVPGFGSLSSSEGGAPSSSSRSPHSSFAVVVAGGSMHTAVVDAAGAGMPHRVTGTPKP